MLLVFISVLLLMLQISLLIMKNHKTEIAVSILPPENLTIQNLFNKNTCHLTSNRPFSHCLCACVYRSRGALFLDNRRDFTEMGQTDFKPLIFSM